jgi:hypothetical protein
MKVCPNCRKRIPVNRTNNDSVHQCESGINAIDEIDVFDPNSGLKGTADRLWGTQAHLEGSRDKGVTDRGLPANLYTQEKRETYIKVR